MGYYILALIVAVGIFVAGFFVGGKWKDRVMKEAGTLKDTVGKL
jgi:hypothetical protein